MLNSKPEERSQPVRFTTLQEFLGLRRDILVLSLAMFAFSLGFQMTTRYISRYLSVLGAGAAIIGLYGSLSTLISAVYPYPGGILSDRIGSRQALTLFGVASTAGFGLWLAAPYLTFSIGPVVVPVWLWIFIGLFLVQSWKSLGLGATFALVKQEAERSTLATGFAQTETFRRVAFLLGPLIAAWILARPTGFLAGFRALLLIAAAAALGGTLVQYWLYDASEDTVGKRFVGIRQIIDDLRLLPRPLRPLLAADTIIRFSNQMVYVFVILVVTEVHRVQLTIWGFQLNPDAFFGVLLAVEMMVALLTMIPLSRLADRMGLKPVVLLGFFVYATFPLALINAPATPGWMLLLFAYSGLRFAGLPAHKALIVGPAAEKEGGRVVGSYYLVRNVVTIPAALTGGWLYGMSPVLAFTIATVVGLAGTLYFLLYGTELPAAD